MKILFVCTGNTCRSPMAEALLLRERPDVQVQSAGIFAGINQRMSQHAATALRSDHIQFEHDSQPVTTNLLQWADLVLTMTTGHKQSLMMQFPDFQELYFTLKEYVSPVDSKTWDELKKRYTDYETKRASFIQTYKETLDEAALYDELSDYLAEDLREIQFLEQNNASYDVSDPFGGSLKVYQHTLDELKSCIHELICKLDKCSSN